MSKQVRTVIYKRIRAGLILSVINISFWEGSVGQMLTVLQTLCQTFSM